MVVVLVVKHHDHDYDHASDLKFPRERGMPTTSTPGPLTRYKYVAESG